MAHLPTSVWLVVGPPLWKIWLRQLGWWDSQYEWENAKNGNQTTNQLWCWYSTQSSTRWFPNTTWSDDIRPRSLESASKDRGIAQHPAISRAKRPNQLYKSLIPSEPIKNSIENILKRIENHIVSYSSPNPPRVTAAAARIGGFGSWHWGLLVQAGGEVAHQILESAS